MVEMSEALKQAKLEHDAAAKELSTIDQRIAELKQSMKKDASTEAGEKPSELLEMLLSNYSTSSGDERIMPIIDALRNSYPENPHKTYHVEARCAVGSSSSPWDFDVNLLAWACEENAYQVVNFLVKDGKIDINERFTSYTYTLTAIHICVLYNSIESFNILVNCPDIVLEFGSSRSLADAAIYQGQPEIIRAILDHPKFESILTGSQVDSMRRALE